MAKNPRRRSKGAERQEAGGDTAGDVIKNLLLFALPGGAIVRVAKGATKAINAVRAMRGAKQIKNPTAAQIKKAKPPSAVTQPKAAPPRPAGSAVAKRGDRRDVKKPGTQATRTDRVIDGDAPRTMRTVTGTRSGRKALPGSSRVRSEGSKVKTATTALQVAAMKDKADNIAGTPKAFAAKATEGGPGRPATKPSKPSKPTKRVDLGTVTARKVTPEAPREREPVSRKEPVKPKVLDSGKNTGFGPNASTFVGGPEERAVMMKYYGGTGKAAAKAAQEGKQGKLKELGMESLKKEMQEARAKRFARDKDKRNKGGVIKKAIGSMDFRMGGTVLSTVDRRRMK
jgi:hypothetical protein